MNRRQFIPAVGCLVGGALTAETVVLRRRKTEFKSTMTTLFWVGEPSDAENAFIANDVSYWDKDWQLSYSGVDDPDRRKGYWPADFRPEETPSMLRCRSASLNRPAAISSSRMLKIFPGTLRVLHPS